MTRIHPCALAVTLDGTIVLNIAHLYVKQDPVVLLERAIAEGGDLFIGVQLTPREMKEATGWLENGAAEAAGHIAARRQRRRRAEARKIRKTPS